MNGPDTAPPVVMSASGQGDTQPLGTVVASLNMELEVATTDSTRRSRTPEAQSDHLSGLGRSCQSIQSMTISRVHLPLEF
jgi:hypothetical protein